MCSRSSTRIRANPWGRASGVNLFTPDSEGRGSCVLRYRTGDISEWGIVYDPCPGCGRIVPRISTTLSRRSDMGELNLTKIRGTLVDLNNFLPAMAGIPDVLEWQLVRQEAQRRSERPR